jgi:hemerythrin-like domain-containing protein
MSNPTSQAATATGIDVHDMVVVHRVFRRELNLLPELVVAVPPGDVARAGVVADHARLVLAGLHLHHTSEDDLLWPLLLERAAVAADEVHRMQIQHGAVDRLVDQVVIVLDRWEAEARPAVADELADVLDELRACVVVHLDEEEATILPLAARTVTAEEWAAIGAAGVAKMTRSQRPLMLGAVIEDASPDERRELLAVLPSPVRLLMRTWGPWHYRRYITRVRAPRVQRGSRGSAR